MGKLGRKQNLSLVFLIHIIGWCSLIFAPNVFIICLCFVLIGYSTGINLCLHYFKFLPRHAKCYDGYRGAGHMVDDRWVQSYWLPVSRFPGFSCMTASFPLLFTFTLRPISRFWFLLYMVQLLLSPLWHLPQRAGFYCPSASYFRTLHSSNHRYWFSFHSPGSQGDGTSGLLLLACLMCKFAAPNSLSF